MTTIAWDGTTMAADTQAADSFGLKHTNVTKIYRFTKRAFNLPPVFAAVLVGFAGNTAHSRRFLASMRGASTTIEGILGNEITAQEGFRDFTCLLVTKKSDGSGDVEIFLNANGEGFTRLNGAKQFAIGSGRDFAIASMDYGNTAKAAVEYAASRDLYTGGEVVTDDFEDLGAEETQKT